MWNFDVYIYEIFFEGVQKSENFDFSKNGLNHIFIYICDQKRVWGPPKDYIRLYIHIYPHYMTLGEKKFFWKFCDFCKFWEILINRNSADWPAGNGRNHDLSSQMVSPDVLEAFSYVGHYYMTCRSNFITLWNFTFFLHFQRFQPTAGTAEIWGVKNREILIFSEMV